MHTASPHKRLCSYDLLSNSYPQLELTGILSHFWFEKAVIIEHDYQPSVSICEAENNLRNNEQQLAKRVSF